MAEEEAELTNIDEKDIVFETKRQYDKYMTQYYSDKPMTGPWTRKWIKEMKTMLWLYGQNKPLWRPEYFKKIVKNQYHLDDKRKERKLKRVIKGVCEVYKELLTVAWEDAFNIIWKMHLECNHGSVTETLDLIKDEYFMDVQCVQCVINLCQECNEKNKSADTAVPPILNKKATVEFLDLSSMPDGRYKYVIIYTDVGTGLVQLRALMEKSDMEITLKLMKIFTDFGLPKIFTIYQPYEFYTIIDMLNMMFKPCKINLEIGILSQSKSEYVKNLLLEWMKIAETHHWQIGCHVVQWDMNNISTDGTTPQSLVFGPHSLQGHKENPPTSHEQDYIMSSSADTLNNPCVDSPDSLIRLFEEPATVTQTTDQDNSKNNLHNTSVQPEQQSKKQYSYLDGSPVPDQRRSNILNKSYVNKKVVGK